MYSQDTSPLLRLQVVADADPTAIARVVDRFQNLNVLPRRLIAEFSTNDLLHIAVDVFGMSESQLTLIVAKLRESPMIVSARWHHIQ
jgi:hypothetical protein